MDIQTLVEISQNVTTPFTTTCDLQSFVTKFGIFATTRPNFNYFGHSHNYDATITNFIILVGLILHLFSSINQLIHPINRNNHQINCILKVFYNDIGVYFNTCTKIIYDFIFYIFQLVINQDLTFNKKFCPICCHCLFSSPW